MLTLAVDPLPLANRPATAFIMFHGLRNAAGLNVDPVMDHLERVSSRVWMSGVTVTQPGVQP